MRLIVEPHHQPTKKRGQPGKVVGRACHSKGAHFVEPDRPVLLDPAAEQANVLLPMFESAVGQGYVCCHRYHQLMPSLQRLFHHRGAGFRSRKFQSILDGDAIVDLYEMGGIKNHSDPLIILRDGPQRRHPQPLSVPSARLLFRQRKHETHFLLLLKLHPNLLRVLLCRFIIAVLCFEVRFVVAPLLDL